MFRLQYSSYSHKSFMFLRQPKVADEIVLIWRNLIPPGRFLDRADEKELGEDEEYTSGRWVEVGDTRAKTKTCQCLRGKV